MARALRGAATPRACRPPAMDLLLSLALVILAAAAALGLLQLAIALFKAPSCRQWLRRGEAK